MVVPDPVLDRLAVLHEFTLVHVLQLYVSAAVENGGSIAPKAPNAAVCVPPEDRSRRAVFILPLVAQDVPSYS